MTNLQKVFFYCGIMLQLFLSLASLQHKGLTYDECHHFNYGYDVLQGDPELDRLPEMPSSVLNVLFSDRRAVFEEQTKSGRIVTVYFLLALSVLVFKWSKELYGYPAAIFSLYLVCLDPNLIAHGHLVTNDVFAAFSITLALYCYWKFLKNGGSGYAILSAETVALSQLSKYTALFLYPIFLCIVIIYHAPVIFDSWKNRDFTVLRRMGASFLKYVSIFLLVNILIINAGYGFHKPFVPLKDYSFKSHLFKSIQSVPVINSIPVPWPHPYVRGIDILKYIGDTADTYSHTYLLGQLHANGQGFKGYYLITILFKTPIAVFCIFLMALFNYRRLRKASIFKDEAVFLLVPIAFYLYFINRCFNLDLGVRYILFIYPLIYVFSGSLFVFWEKYSFKLRAFFILLMVYLAVSVFSYFPHFLSYFNEFVWDRKMAYKILVDSNLDWGGDEWYLQQYIKQHPNSIFFPCKPTAGRIIVSANSVVGVIDKLNFHWLKDNFEPVDQIAYSYLVYDIKESDLKRVLHRSK